MSSNVGGFSQIYPLRYVLKHAALLHFDISVINADGTRKTDT